MKDIGLTLSAGRPARIAEEIGRRIVMGELPPGTPLPPETVLLEELGVSRTTLREAFKILAAKGMLSAKPKVGTIVRPESAWSLLDPEVLGWLFESGDLDAALVELFETRRMIETEAAGLAADMASPPDVARIRAAYDRMAEPGLPVTRALDADVAFHRAIIEASANRFMRALGDVSETALRATVKLSVRRPGGLPHSLPQHLAVLRAIEARDVVAARTAMSELIQNAQSDAVEAARERRREAVRRASA
jgi:DNA-binding FadR family transcriptional regulator